MMHYRVAFEFRLARRASWSGDGSDFYDHVEDVRQKIAVHESITEVRVITDFAESSLTVDLQLDRATELHVGEDALRIVREAIESCDARHFGLTALDSSSMIGSGGRSGLETPIWHKRRVLVELAA